MRTELLIAGKRCLDFETVVHDSAARIVREKQAKAAARRKRRLSVSAFEDKLNSLVSSELKAKENARGKVDVSKLDRFMGARGAKARELARRFEKCRTRTQCNS